MITRRVIASASLAAIGFTASLVPAPRSYADGGLLTGGLNGVVTGVTNEVTDTVDTVLDGTGIGSAIAVEVIAVEPGSEDGSTVLDARVDASLSGGEGVSLDAAVQVGNTSLAAEAAAGGQSLLQADANASIADDLTFDLAAAALGPEGVLNASTTVGAGELEVGASVGPDLGTEVEVIPVPATPDVPVTLPPATPGVVPPAPAMPAPAVEAPTWGIAPASAIEGTGTATTTTTAPSAPQQSVPWSIEFPPLPWPAITSIAGSASPPTIPVGPARLGSFEVQMTGRQAMPAGGMPLRVRTLLVPPPTPLESAAVSAGSSGGVFDSLNDVFGNVAGLLGGAAAGSSNGAPAPGGGIAVAILAAILVLAARLLMSVQWTGRTGLPESPPSYVLVPPG